MIQAVCEEMWEADRKWEPNEDYQISITVPPPPLPPTLPSSSYYPGGWIGGGDPTISKQPIGSVVSWNLTKREGK